MMRRYYLMILVTLVTTLLTASVAVAGFCGENGVVRFSFEEGPDLVPVATIEAAENGVTMVDLYAWLTDVVPLKKNGEAFLGTAAFELKLVIEGSEGFILKQEYLQPTRQVGKELGTCIVGLNPGLNFKDGAVQLVHWEIMFQGKPEDVVFRLDPEGLFTCGQTEGCPESGVSALYTGTESGNSIGAIFGAGHQPAYLNYSGVPDLEAVHGTVTWQDVGQYEKK